MTDSEPTLGEVNRNLNALRASVNQQLADLKVQVNSQDHVTKEVFTLVVQTLTANHAALERRVSKWAIALVTCLAFPAILLLMGYLLTRSAAQ